MARTIYYSTAPVWDNWATTTYASSTDTTSTALYVWGYWTAGTSSTATDSSTAYVWDNWVTAQYIAEPVQETETQRQQRQAAEAEAAARRTEEVRRREEAQRKISEQREKAEKKSRELLVALLTPAQVKELNEKNAFGFISPSGKVFEIHKGRAGNIIMQEGKKRTRLCCHPEKQVPVYDNLIAQLLSLMFDEEAFLQLANKTLIER